MNAWHFLKSNRRLACGRPTKVKVGQTLRRDPNRLELCHYGLHASYHPFDALRYAPGPILCRVRLGGKIIRDEDKVVAGRRTVLAMRDFSREIRLFACWCVRHMRMEDGRTVWDNINEHLRRAVITAERFANGEATKEELHDARLLATEYVCDDASAAARHTCYSGPDHAAYDAAWCAARFYSHFLGKRCNEMRAKAEKMQRDEFERIVMEAFS
jgi:hypothetical protein